MGERNMYRELLIQLVTQHEEEHPREPIYLTREQLFWLRKQEPLSWPEEQRPSADPVLGKQVEVVKREEDATPARESWPEEALALVRPADHQGSK